MKTWKHWHSTLWLRITNVGSAIEGAKPVTVPNASVFPDGFVAWSVFLSLTKWKLCCPRKTWSPPPLLRSWCLMSAMAFSPGSETLRAESTNRIAPGHFKVLLSLFCKHMQTSFCCVCGRRRVPWLGAAEENAGQLREFLKSTHWIRLTCVSKPVLCDWVCSIATSTIIVLSDWLL